MLSRDTVSVDCTSETSSAKTTANPLQRTTNISLDLWTASKHLLVQMPVDMAVEKPWPRVISHKTNRNVISRIAHADYVTQYRVVIVIGAVPCAANNIESVSMKMNRMLSRRHT